MEPVQVIEASAPGRSGEMPPADAGPIGSDEDIGLPESGSGCMLNRYVDGLATIAPEDPAAYAAGAQRLINEGYLPPTD